MIHSVRFTVVLDTNVIYPLVCRDLLFWFAYYDLYTLKWSKHIFDEWYSVMKRKDISKKEATKRVEVANKDFPETILSTYGIKAKSADDFLTDIIDINHDISVEAFKEMVINKKNPELDEYEVLDQLRNNGLKDTANYLHALI